MPTFTPPSIPFTPPVSVSDTRTGPTTKQSNPLGYALMRYYPTRAKGVNIWHMKDNTWLMSDPVPGVNFLGTITYPYPDTLAPVNNAISSSWFPGGPGGVGGSGPGGLQQLVTPGIAVEYLGGHSYPVSSAEAALITSVGLGAFLT